MESYRTCDGFGIVEKLAKSRHRGPVGLFALFIRMDWFGIRLDHFYQWHDTKFSIQQYKSSHNANSHWKHSWSHSLHFLHRPPIFNRWTHSLNRHARDIPCILVFELLKPTNFHRGCMEWDSTTGIPLVGYSSSVRWWLGYPSSSNGVLEIEESSQIEPGVEPSIWFAVQPQKPQKPHFCDNNRKDCIWRKRCSILRFSKQLMLRVSLGIAYFPIFK